MKNTYTYILFLALLILTTAGKCHKEKNEEPQLPPETTTGAYTFGCKVNGKVFVPMDGRGKPGLYAQYVFLGNAPGGGWFLNIPAVDQVSNERTTVNIGTDSLLLGDGNIYLFREKKGFASGRYSNGFERYEMLSFDTGELTITKHDAIRRILSGRFWFNATNLSNQTKVEIREGRFDIVY